MIDPLDNLEILFDFDGTLVLTDDIYYKVWKQLLCKDITREWYNANIRGKSDKDVMSHLGFDKDISTKDELFLEYSSLGIEQVPGSIEFVRKCLHLNIPCGIVTNCNRISVETILKRFNIDIPITIGDECARPKPFPDPYIKARHNRKITIVFEDTPTGIQSARSSGVDYVIGLTTSFSESILLSHGANLCIADFSEDIFSILEKIKEIKISIDQEYRYLEKECERILSKSQISSSPTLSGKIHHDIPCRSVMIEKQFLKGGYIANIQKVIMDDRVFVIKRENESDHCFNKIAKDLMLYEREYFFYERISSHIKLKTPKYFGTIYRDTHKKGIILEYLDDDYTFNPSIDENGLELIIKRIAEMHNESINKFDLMKPKDFKDWYKFCLERWDRFEEKWQCLGKQQLEIGKKILDRYVEIQHKLSEGELTLIHGDLKIPNIAMYKNKTEFQEPYFLDWQYIANGKGIQDIAFLLVESFELNDHIKILNLYRKYGGDTSDFIYALCYFPFYVAMWFGTVEDKDLIDVNFPPKFIKKLFSIYERYLSSAKF